MDVPAQTAPALSEKYVFISYSGKDLPDAENLKKVFEGNGVRCWLNTDNINTTKAFPGALTRAIKNPDCCFLVLLLTKNINGSDHILRELSLASDNKKPIIPIAPYGKPKMSDDVEYYLAGLTIKDIKGINNISLEKIINDIKNDM